MNIKTISSQKIFIAIIVMVFVVVGVLNFNSSSKIMTANASIDKYAREAVKECEEAPYRPTCYEETLAELTSEISTEEIFDVIRQVRQYDPEYLFCHVLAHELGEYDMSMDPENWLDVLSLAPPDGLCSNGYTHGAALAKFNDEVLSEEELQSVIPDFSIACEQREGWNPTDLQKAICYHGLGHVLIHLTDAKVNPSLDVCELIALKDDGSDYRHLCVEGIYMQLFQPLEPEDFALIDQLDEPPTKDNIEEFCAENSNTEVQRGTCWREAWPLFYDDLFDPEGVTDYCDYLPVGPDREQCYVSSFTINGRHNLGNPDKMAHLCNNVEPERQGVCFARGANAFSEEDPNLVPQAIDMCSRAESAAVQDECYQFLAATASFNFHVGSEPYENLCNNLPAQYQESCRIVR